MTDQEIPRCPHCDQPLKKWRCPPDSTWGTEFQWVCFNDDCSYYVKGWKWMLERFQHRSSYRHRMNPETGEQGPLPVWSSEALKNQIIEE